MDSDSNATVLRFNMKGKYNKLLQVKREQTKQILVNSRQYRLKNDTIEDENMVEQEYKEINHKLRCLHLESKYQQQQLDKEKIVEIEIENNYDQYADINSILYNAHSHYLQTLRNKIIEEP